MTKHVWKLKDYGHRWSAEQIADEMNILARDGWEINHINSIPEHYEISRMPSEVSGLNDGDSISMTSTMRVVFRK
ncbi:hypothetical protein N9R09_04390 [Porticoccaceae bacterium]|jgi:hypothetical protein|nr:hypothetical protein [Porticoccaceae bacterium]